MIRVVLAATVCVCGFVVPERAFPQATGRAQTTFTIRGTIPVDSVYGGARSVNVIAHKAVPSGELTVDITRRGHVANPIAKSDSRGRFSIVVPRGFLPKDGRIILSCACGQWMRSWQLVDARTGDPIVIQPGPGVRVIELGPVQVRDPGVP